MIFHFVAKQAKGEHNSCRISGDELLELFIFASTYILLRRFYSLAAGGGREEENKSEKLCQHKHLKGSARKCFPSGSNH